MRKLLQSCALFAGALASAAEPRVFLEKHCYECHDKETKKGGLDLESLGSEKKQLDHWIKIHDAVADGEMPPAKKKSQPTASEKAAFVAELDTRLTAASTAAHPAGTQLRRLKRQEFDKIASGLDLSPGHLAAYQEAIEKALDIAIATQSTAPRGFRIAGADKVWKPASARIEGTEVIVSSPEVATPVAARYAWAENPDCNLVNGAGLPATSFRTDDWDVPVAVAR